MLRSVRALPVACAVVLAALPARATHLGVVSGDLARLRQTVDPDEGYLNFKHFDLQVHGAEYTGYTDNQGSDWADNWILVNPIGVRDSATAIVTPLVRIANDFEFMRKIYAQAGIAVFRVGNDPIVTLPVEWNDFDEVERAKL